MTDALNEQLSALLDGELPDSEAELCLKRLERNAPLRATLGRYALIGEALKATAPVAAAPPDFAARVNAALDAPLEAAPMSARAALWRSAGGLGVAAAVGALALVLVGRGTPQPAAPLAVVGSTAPVVANVRPAAAPLPSMAELLRRPEALKVAGNGEPAASYVTPLPNRSSVPLRPASEFANYVVAHAEYVSPLDRRNVLSGLVAADGSTVWTPAEAPGSFTAAFPPADPALSPPAVGSGGR